MSSSQLTNSIIFQDGVALAHQPDVLMVPTLRIKHLGWILWRTSHPIVHEYLSHQSVMKISHWYAMNIWFSIIYISIHQWIFSTSHISARRPVWTENSLATRVAHNDCAEKYGGPQSAVGLECFPHFTMHTGLGESENMAKGIARPSRFPANIFSNWGKTQWWKYQFGFSIFPQKRISALPSASVFLDLWTRLNHHFQQRLVHAKMRFITLFPLKAAIFEHPSRLRQAQFRRIYHHFPRFFRHVPSLGWILNPKFAWNPQFCEANFAWRFFAVPRQGYSGKCTPAACPCGGPGGSRIRKWRFP